MITFKNHKIQISSKTLPKEQAKKWNRKLRRSIMIGSQYQNLWFKAEKMRKLYGPLVRDCKLVLPAIPKIHSKYLTGYYGELITVIKKAIQIITKKSVKTEAEIKAEVEKGW